MLEHFGAVSQNQYTYARVYLGSLAEANPVKQIVDAAACVSSRIDHVGPHVHYEGEYRVVFGVDFVEWLEEVSPTSDVPTTAYHLSLKHARERCEKFVRRRQSEYACLIDILERKYGKQGCLHCGRTASECRLEFDHVDPAQKVKHVSDLVNRGQWKGRSRSDAMPVIVSAMPSKEGRLSPSPDTRRGKGTSGGE